MCEYRGLPRPGITPQIEQAISADPNNLRRAVQDVVIYCGDCVKHTSMGIDTPHGLKPERMLGSTAAAYRHDSPKGLPGPLDVSGRVLVAVEDEATGGTDMGAHAQTSWARAPHSRYSPGWCRQVARRRLDARRMLPWLRGWLGTAPSPRPRWTWRGGDSAPGWRPASLRDRWCRSLLQQLERGLVVEVGALPLHRLMRPLEVAHRFPPAVAALLATGDAALRLRQLLLAAPIVAWVLDHLPVGGDEEHLQAHVNARLASRGRQAAALAPRRRR